MILHAILAVWALSTAAHAHSSDDDAIFSEPTTMKAYFTPRAVNAMIENGATVEKVASEKYGHPIFIVKAGLGLPNLVSARVEIFIEDEVSLEVGAGTGLLPVIYEGAIHLRPKKTCWGCGGKNSFSLGMGMEYGLYFGGEGAPSDAVGVMVFSTLDALYMRRIRKHFGFSVGAPAGVGFTTDFVDGKPDFPPEPAFKLNVLEMGLVF